MNNTFRMGSYYRLENFSAVPLEFQENGKMFFVLPDKGYTPEDLLSDAEFAEFAAFGGSKAQSMDADINFSVPKFDVTDQTDLREGLKNLGVTDVFDISKADFEIWSGRPLCVTNATQSARVVIDENGCKAAAASRFNFTEGVHDKVNFVLDRPFIFVITGDSGLPLFVGIVNVPV